MSHWIVCPKPQPSADIRLFCFPYAGAGVAVFRDWGKDLGPNVEVCCIQSPGREHRLRERAFEHMRDLLPPLIGSLRPWLDRPYAIYGHSLGGRIAFEAARELRRIGAPQPAHFFVGASPAPQLPWSQPSIRFLPEIEFLNEIQKRYGGVPKEVIADAEMRALLVPTLRADVGMMETYEYEPDVPLGCAITAIGGQADRIVPPSAMDPWREQTSSSCILHLLKGDHFFLLSERQRLLALIAQELARLTEARLAVAPFYATNSNGIPL
jgi:medium-chain acyl-[acyl-carrier-protein] hydrolase